MEQWKEDILAHYGILGMKWGVRRYQSYDEKPRLSGKVGKEIGKAAKKVKSSVNYKIEANRRRKNEDSENKRIVTDRRKAVKNRRLLSDSELDKRISRLRKENDLKKLTTENLDDVKVKRGNGALKKILGPPATKAAQAVLVGLGIYAGQKMVEKMLGKEAASLVRLPKK